MLCGCFYKKKMMAFKSLFLGVYVSTFWLKGYWFWSYKYIDESQVVGLMSVFIYNCYFGILMSLFVTLLY